MLLGRPHHLRFEARAMTRCALYLLAPLFLGGCYLSSAPDADGGTRDSPRGPCDPVGTLTACGEGCGGHFPCTAMGADYICLDGVCINGFWVDPPPGRTYTLGCDLPFGPPGIRSFSHRGDQACYLSEEFSRPGSSPTRGFTIPESDCDALSSVRGLECYWSDGSIRTQTPPAEHTTCPAMPTPGSVLCGGPCGSCTFTVAGGVDDFSVPCLGRNDERDLGVCGLVREGTTGCSPEMPPNARCLDPLFMDQDWPGATCACLSFRRADGFERAGWVVPSTNCATYRALYPGEVECFDDAWEPLR